MARSSRTSQASQARAARQIKRLYEMCAMAIVAGRADLDGAAEVGFDIELPVFSVGAAASSPTCIRRRCASMIALAWSYRNVRKVARDAIRCATSPASRKRSNSARRRASTWLESRASSNLRKRTASCAAKWSGCASRPVPACSPRTRRWHRGSRAVPARAHVAQAAASRCTAASVARIRTGGTCGRGGRYGLQVSGSLGNSLTAHSLTFLKSAGKP